MTDKPSTLTKSTEITIECNPVTLPKLCHSMATISKAEGAITAEKIFELAELLCNSFTIRVNTFEDRPVYEDDGKNLTLY